MNSGKFGLYGAVAVILLGIVYSAAFVVNQWEVAIKLRLGEIIDSDYEPGLHWMVPVINEVKKFDGRIQTLDSQPQRFLTIEEKDVIVKDEGGDDGKFRCPPEADDHDCDDGQYQKCQQDQRQWRGL